MFSSPSIVINCLSEAGYGQGPVEFYYSGWGKVLSTSIAPSLWEMILLVARARCFLRRKQTSTTLCPHIYL